MNKIVRVCLAKHGRFIVIAMLNSDGDIVAAAWASNGKPVHPDSLVEVDLHPEFGSLTIA